ncbi:MAG TPA: protease modulator HflC [Rhizomicrobium sp.]|jgi:membrane protease subunit HflC|nr:protease modulator HflC [Rhizomicrobium sp.]
MSRSALMGVGVAIAAVVLFALSCFYSLRQNEQAVLLQFDAPREIVTEPGLHVKIPWVQQVEYIDKRLLNLDAPPEEVIAQDKKRMVVDAFARWRIIDPLRFYQTLTNTEIAETRLAPILSSDVRQVLGSQNFAVVLSGERAQLMHDIRDHMNRESASFGIKIVDVRIRHADLPPQNSKAIYDRMIQERAREANEFRADGSEIYQRIKARADREVTVLTAEATRESDILRGQGDAEKTRILGEAYGQDPDFFAFYRSLQAYQDALGGNSTTMVLSPSSEFFKYMNQPQAGSAKRK